MKNYEESKTEKKNDLKERKMKEMRKDEKIGNEKKTRKTKEN